MKRITGTFLIIAVAISLHYWRLHNLSPVQKTDASPAIVSSQFPRVVSKHMPRLDVTGRPVFDKLITKSALILERVNPVMLDGKYVRVKIYVPLSGEGVALHFLYPQNYEFLYGLYKDRDPVAVGLIIVFADASLLVDEVDFVANDDNQGTPWNSHSVYLSAKNDTDQVDMFGDAQKVLNVFVQEAKLSEIIAKMK